ncbi:MAG TPA: NAD-dependent epimerase/dehydratase family protein [Thermoanaerobaculia bacterium]|nr:NAD-dependent epimerase/dehydratase family protein [Thermoanaerobaculia bacterium]
MSAPLAVVTGGSGFVGSHVVDELLRRGARVRCVLRRSSSTRWLDGKPVEIVVTPLDDAPKLAAAVAGAAWIVHAAGVTSARNPAEFYEANVGGTERMIRAALTVGPELRRFLIVSSQAAAGPSRDGMPVTEAHPPRPVSPYGESKLRAEELTLQMRDRLPVVSIRPPAVYGPRDLATLKIFAAVKRHIQPVLRAGGKFSLVHVEDLARACCLALEDDRARGEVFFVAEPDVCDYDTMGRQAKRALGTWAVRFEPPPWLLGGVALAGEAIGALTNRPAFLSRQKLREITSGDWICSSAKMRARLGWAPQMTLEAGFAQTAAWYRDAGWV